MNSENKKRLKLYIICCHADRPLLEDIEHSIYEIPIQAGAALTDKRICDLNDFDGFSNSISEKNRRYCEATAMYWIYRHLDETPYIGIAHYRRRLELSDKEYDELMDKGVDIITSVPVSKRVTIEELFKYAHYAYDWDMLLNVLKEKEPDDYQFDLEIFRMKPFLEANVNVFRSEIYKKFCDWAFPILKELEKRIPEKTDLYNRRDVAFISERLSHLFVMKMVSDGMNVVYAPLVQYKSEIWSREKVCDYNNQEEVYSTCSKLFKDNKIRQLIDILYYCNEKGFLSDRRIYELSYIIFAAEQERKEGLPRTLFEYLPLELRWDLDTLIDTWETLRKVLIIKDYKESVKNDVVVEKFLRITGFSEIAVSVRKMNM